MMADSECAHLAALTALKPPSHYHCDECVKIGAHWVHLRTCQECGGTHCCDSSPNLIFTRGASPLGLPDTLTRGGPMPRSVRVAHVASLVRT
jgi:hypothetical protein